MNNPVGLNDPTGKAPACDPPGSCDGVAGALESIRVETKNWSASLMEGASWLNDQVVRAYSGAKEKLGTANRATRDTAENVSLAADIMTATLAVATVLQPQIAPASGPAIAKLQTVARAADIVEIGTSAVDEFGYGGESGQTMIAAGGALLGEGMGKMADRAANGIIRYAPEGRGSQFRWPSRTFAPSGAAVGGQYAPNSTGHRVHAAADATAIGTYYMLYGLRGPQEQ